MTNPPDRFPDGRPPTMRDVARAAGVHQTTVSRALRNDPRITAEVRRRVSETAAALGYRPNPLLSVLASVRRGRTREGDATTIAYVVPATPSRGPSLAHVEGVRRAVERSGYKLEVFTLNSALRPRRLNAVLRARGIRGVIIGPLPEARGGFELDWARFCTVVIEYSFATPAFDRVVTDSFSSMNLAIERCRERGFTRLGVVLARMVDERNQGLLCAAYALARERDEAQADIPPLLLERWSERPFEAWLERHRPEVIISSNALLPELRSFLKKRGLAVPRQVSLVNLNVSPASPDSGVCQDAPAIGEPAARLVIGKLNHNDYGVPASRHTVLTEGRWCEGRTLGRPPRVR